MIALNRALAHEIIRSSHDSNAARAARYHSTLHPAALRAAFAVPASRPDRSGGIAPFAMIQRAVARMVASVAPTPPACCPAAV